MRRDREHHRLFPLLARRARLSEDRALMLEIYLVCAPGLETLLAAESRALGLRVRSTEAGGVTVDGGLRDVVRANIGLRTASRVLVRVASFRVTAFHELERSARRIAWERFVGAAPVRVRATCRKSKLYHSDAVAERVLGAIQRVTGTGDAPDPGERAAPRETRAPAKEGKSAKPAKGASDSRFIPAKPTAAAKTVAARAAAKQGIASAAAKASTRAANEAANEATANEAAVKARTLAPDRTAQDAGDAREEADEGAGAQLVVVRLFRDECTISIDSSGALLHRRGYRQATAKAPLRETLAAAMLLGADWRGDTPLVDPLCGAGTIPIEAALVARRIAPGRARAERGDFAIASWPELPAGEIEQALSEFRGNELASARVPIVGSDRDAGAIEASVANAERAGVAADVHFVQRVLSAAEPVGDAAGLLIANPPYGVRLSEGADVRNIYAQLGKVAHFAFPDWRVGLLSPDRALESQTRLPLRQAFETTNGGIRVRYLVAVPTPGPELAE
ncbi:MAG: class I SAM-dependent RNA methyltransferase [Gemmatimonadaceae bacterium]